jgi:hypothetical protein
MGLLGNMAQPHGHQVARSGLVVGKASHQLTVRPEAANTEVAMPELNSHRIKAIHQTQTPNLVESPS